MSAVAVNSTLARGVTFYSSTVGKKVVMAVTGIILFGFLLATWPEISSSFWGLKY